MSEYDEIDYDEEDELADSQESKFLLFKLSGEEFGISIGYVIEIIGYRKATLLPEMPDFIKGVLNLRDEVLPIVDMRTRFMMPTSAASEKTCIIVVRINDCIMGLIVDEVSEVTVIAPEDVDAPPKQNVDFKNKFISGIAKTAEKVLILLSVEEVLTNEEIEELSELE